MGRGVRIGVQLWPGGAPDYATWREAVITAEGMGVDVIFGYDHFHRPAVTIVDNKPVLDAVQPDVANFEGWTALASWAEVTSRAEIGLLVTGMGYRNPELLADMARTVDHISGGRVILGVGAGWYEKDYTAYGYDYGTVGSRMATFTDGLRRMEHRLTQLVPPPVRPIPVLIGGSGERKVLPAVGRHAHIWHSFSDLDTFRRKSALVKEHALAAGRADSDIERSLQWPGLAAADSFTAAGVTLFTTEIHPTAEGYDFAELKELLTWRDGRA